jgi:hypothetical protein
VCTPYECITGGALRPDELQDFWPPDPPCQAGEYRIGVLTERHWQFHRKYAVCVEGTQTGTIHTCTGDLGTCSPALCTGGMVEVGFYYDRSNQPHVQQRICLGDAISGLMKQCTASPVGSTCTLPACDAGSVELGTAIDHYPAAGESYHYRFCVVPLCPPNCP